MADVVDEMRTCAKRADQGWLTSGERINDWAGEVEKLRADLSCMREALQLADRALSVIDDATPEQGERIDAALEAISAALSPAPE